MVRQGASRADRVIPAFVEVLGLRRAGLSHNVGNVLGSKQVSEYARVPLAEGTRARARHSKEDEVQPPKDSDIQRRRSPDAHRRRAVAAMAEAVAEHGYAGTTVEDILSRAGMSRRTFYQLFRNREECFLATYDAALEEAMERLALAHGGNGRRWAGQVEVALAALFEYLAAEPDLARVWLVEAPSLGPAGIERHERTMKQLAERLAGLRSDADAVGANGQATVAFEASVGAVHRVVQARLLGGRADELPGLAPHMASVVRGLVSPDQERAGT
jgi:AcrR family transcriptional regulator